MDVKEMYDGLSLGAKILIGLVGAFGVLFITVMIYSLFVGVVNNAAQTSGIPVSTAILTDLNNTEADWISAKDLVTDNTTIIAGLVALAVIIAVLGFMIWKKGNKGTSSNAEF